MSDMKRPTILLADDHAVLRDGLVRLLEPEFEVIGALADGRALVEEAARLRPGAVIFDIGMPLLNGIEAARQVRALVPESKLVFLTQHGGTEYVQAAFRLGASAFLMKSAAGSELLTAVREALAGRYYLSPELRQGREFDPGRDPSELFGGGLTSRQREVLQLVAEGKTAKEIAKILGISAKTVEFHKAGIMDELGLRTTADLTRYAIAQGIVTVERFPG